MKLRLLVGITFLFSFRIALAQEISFSIVPVDSNALKAAGAYPSKFNNELDAHSFLKNLVPKMQEQGYLAASIDSVTRRNNTITAYVYGGLTYRWAQLTFGNIPLGMMNDLGITEKDWINKPLSPRKLAVLTEKLLNNADNNGYPFATVSLDSVQVSQGIVSGKLMLDRGNQVKIDSVVIDGGANISPDFLYTYLGIHPGDAYNESALKSIRKKIADLPYLRESEPWKMEFGLGDNKLKLYLEEKKSNQINGLIGIQPNTVETGKLMLTADILLSLKNALSYGESFSLTYQQLQYKSPRFLLNVDWPYVLGSDIGIDGDFELFKRDTTFYRTTFNAGVRYLFNATDYARLFYNQNSNRVASPDLNYVKANKALPPDIDVASQGVGVEYLFSRTNYRLNPRKGFEGKASAVGLLRTVRKNDAILSLDDGSGFDYATLYDTVQQRTYQYRLSAQAAYYLSLWKNVVLKIAYSGGYISGKNLFLNEMFQIGGFKLLRGFDEQSLYVNQYHVGTVELRLLLNENSYFYIFSDDAYTQTHYGNINRDDVPIGLGAGISLETKGGIFSIAFAVGKHEGDPLQFRQTKIHFGYVAYF